MQAVEIWACQGGREGGKACQEGKNAAPVITSCQPSLYSPLRIMLATNLFCWSSLLSSCCWPILSCRNCSRLGPPCCSSWSSPLSASRQPLGLGPCGDCRCPALSAPVKSNSSSHGDNKQSACITQTAHVLLGLDQKAVLLRSCVCKLCVVPACMLLAANSVSAAELSHTQLQHT